MATMPTHSRRHPTGRRVAALAVVGASLLSLATACGSTSSGTGAPGDPLQVVAAFYPLEWIAQQVGGDHVVVRSLTKPGAEPHDLELTPRDVGAVQDAAVVTYLSGFQPAVDTAMDDAGGAAFDARDAARLDRTFTPIEDGASAADEADTTDPHFWLDPERTADVADAFAETLATTDPDHAKDYRTNAARLRARLDVLDRDYRAGLDDCDRTSLVTSHNAFGYLADRYGLEQVGITGLTPEGEPSPKDLAQVADYVERNDVETIYFETLTSPAVAKTLARETGATAAVLDPIEGLADGSGDADYLTIMRANLDALREGLGCR